MRTAQQLFEAAFHAYRDPRSEEYRNGVLAALTSLEQRKRVVCPYPSGTASADAFHAGVNEGHGIYRREMEDQADAAQQPYTG